MSDMNDIEMRALTETRDKAYYEPRVPQNWDGGFREGWNAMREFALKHGYVPPEPPPCGAKHPYVMEQCKIVIPHDEHRALISWGNARDIPAYIVWSDPEPETEAAT